MAALLAPACSNAHYVADADAEVASVLTRGTADTLGDREAKVLRPELTPLPPPDQPGEAGSGEKAAAPPSLPGAPPRTFNLSEALSTAVQCNRDFLARREGLYRSGLSIALTRFQFGPQFTSAVHYLWPRNEAGAESHQVGGSLAATQILPTGGQLGLSTGVDAQWPLGPGSGDPTWSSSAGVSLTQPLLRGAGHDIAYEPLTAAEREFAYAIRDFELFREQFSIGIAKQYFDLVSVKKTLANQDANYDAAVFDRRKAEAMQLVGRNAEKDVFLARRREIDTKDQLLNARAAYD